MARLVSNEFHYIGIPTGWHDLPEHELIVAYFDHIGLHIWLKLYLACFALNGYYLKVNEGYIALTARKYSVTVEYMHDLLRYLAEGELIDRRLFEEHGIITSRDIQIIFQEASKERGRKRLISVENDYWLLSKAETAPYINLLAKDGTPISQNHSSTEKSDSSAEKSNSSVRKDKTGEEMTRDETETTGDERENKGLRPTPIARRRSRRAVKAGRRMTGQSVSRRCEYLRRVYEEICGSVLPKQESLTECHISLTRKSALSGFTVGDHRRVFASAAANPFLSGQVGRWRASFEWLINPENMKKVLSGAYVDFKTPPHSKSGMGASVGTAPHDGGSFDTDEFFEAALRRTFRDMAEAKSASPAKPYPSDEPHPGSHTAPLHLTEGELPFLP